MVSSVSIREISPADAEPVARLSGELGYPVSTTAMERRIRETRELPNHVVYVACLLNPERVVGWIDVSIAHHLQSEPYGEIGGLVVSSECRNLGIGQKLVRRGEVWVAQKEGMNRMVVRSQVTREAAHRFYLREGYTHWKNSAVFSKELIPSAVS